MAGGLSLLGLIASDFLLFFAELNAVPLTSIYEDILRKILVLPNFF
jgi:hypothetical protein